MCVPTFAECKKILEDFYKQREQFIINDIDIIQDNPFIIAYTHVDYLHFTTYINFKEDKFLINDLHKNLKPIITYALSYTRLRKFANYPNLFLTENPPLIKYDYENIVDREIYVKDLEIILKTYYDFYDANYDIYFDVLAELENNNELLVFRELPSLEIPPLEKPKVINLFKIFKSDECIICMVNKPNILFCNCGHLCECEGCYKIKTLSTCPICKTDNEIIRMLE